MTRNRTIDIARGIAILSIIVGHLNVWTINRIVYTYHVPIFFLLTGYFMKEESLCLHVRKKARTLLVPYAVTCFGIIILAGIIALFKRDNVILTIKDWMFASLYGSGSSYVEPFIINDIGAIWFLWATFWACVFLQLSLRRKPVLRILWIVGLFAVGYLTAKRLFWFPLSIQAGCCATLFMYIGHAVRQSEQRITRLPMLIKVLGTLAAFVLWASFVVQFKTFWFVECDFGRGVIDIIRSLCACYCVVVIALLIDRLMNKTAVCLAFLGRYSIIVLCVHITELKLIHWKKIAEKLLQFNIPWMIGGGIAVALKLVFIITFTVLIVRTPRLRRVFIPERKVL